MIRDLKTKFWVSALIKRAEIFGASAYVMHKGDEDNGSVLVKITRAMRQCRLLIPSRDLNGDLIWVDMTKKLAPDEEENEFTINTYIEKRIKQDSDLWVIEIEDKNDRDFLIERVE